MKIEWNVELDEENKMKEKFNSMGHIVKHYNKLIESNITIVMTSETSCEESRLTIEMEKEEDDNKYDVENVVDLLILLQETVSKGNIYLITPLLHDENLDLDKVDYLHGVPSEMMEDGVD